MTTGYPHERDPVSGAFVAGMARALARRGHSVTVLCAERPGDAPVDIPGVSVIPVRHGATLLGRGVFHDEGAPEKLMRGDVRAWLCAAAFPFAMERAVTRHLRDCDALVSHFVVPCGVVGAGARGDRPHVAVAHGTDARLFGLLPAYVRSRVLANWTHLWASHTAALDAVTKGLPVHRARAHVAPMGYDATVVVPPERTHALRRAFGIEDAVVVLAVGRVVGGKGFDDLVAASWRLRRGTVVLVAGEGSERARLEAQSPAHVRWLGAVDRATLAELRASADLFVAPSHPRGWRSEGAPTSLVEAMGSGLCVIATRAGAQAELVGDAGVLVEPGDLGALARAVDELAVNGERRELLGARAAERARPWAWDTQVRELERALGLATGERSAFPPAATTGTH